MRMRVLAACAAPHSLQDWLLNTTLLSLFSFILLLRLRPGSLSPRTSPRLGLSCAKLNILIIHVKSFYSITLSRPPSAGRRPGPPSSENCLWLSFCVLGTSRILSLQKHHQLRSARVRRHAVFDHISPLAELRRYPCAAPSSDSRPMRLFSKPSFGDLRCKTSLHGSRCTRAAASACPRPTIAHTQRKCVVPVAHAMRGAL